MLGVRFSFKRIMSRARRYSNKANNSLNESSLWSAYNHQLTKRPLLTKSITSGVLSFTADCICQTAFPEEKNKKFDLRRLMNFTVLGTVLVGPLLHTWYGFLVTRIPGTSALATLYRVAFDQLLFAPLCIIPAFFSCSLILDGKPENIVAKLQSDWFPTVTANFALWVPSQIINFRLIAPQYQVLFANIVGFVWNIYLSRQNSKGIGQPQELHQNQKRALGFMEDKEVEEEAADGGAGGSGVIDGGSSSGSSSSSSNRGLQPSVSEGPAPAAMDEEEWDRDAQEEGLPAQIILTRDDTSASE
mmetsp:Transcript_6949/g.11599  ORF Transcript_6949/g.11599 Transcript_6949/m.11599 type:complete len:302 (-) Transcript_6949:464-1369(-)